MLTLTLDTTVTLNVTLIYKNMVQFFAIQTQNLIYNDILFVT